jgi:hypothetical protein
VGHEGLGPRLTGAREVVERWRDDGEGSGGGALSVGLLGARREGRWGGGGVVRRGHAGMPFYRVGGGAGQPDREGNQATGGGAPLWAIRFGGEGKCRGEWGVMRRGGGCGTVFRRGGDTGATRTR